MTKRIEEAIARDRWEGGVDNILKLEDDIEKERERLLVRLEELRWEADIVNNIV